MKQLNLQEHKNYNRMLGKIRQLIREESIKCLAMGGKGYAEYVTDIFKGQHGAAYTEESYSVLSNDVKELVANTYGHEC